MTGKIPPDAFMVYFSLGPDRSYQTVAEHFQVSKRAVVKMAVNENWQERVEKLERKAREATEQKAVETLEAMHTRHLKSVRVIQGKALEALKAQSLSSAMEAVRALELSIKQERLIRGEPTDRSVLAVEDVIRREYARWLENDGDTEEEAAEDDHDAEEQTDQ